MTTPVTYITITGLHSTHGSVVLFNATVDDDANRDAIIVAVEHRAAGSILETLDVFGQLADWVEPWQIVTRREGVGA